MLIININQKEIELQNSEEKQSLKEYTVKD